MSSPLQNIGGFLAACEVEFEGPTVMFLIFSRISAFDSVLILAICSLVFSLIFTILSMYDIVTLNNQ